ncbi:RanBP2-type zinc finger protein [Citrus sinensis]|nr:RanBP2-type zinc finger protein [Citrus sinensis]
MSQVDNRNSSAAKRARTDGSRREDDWTCPSCGNVNFSFRMTCNMRNCTQPRPADHNSKPAAKPLQAPQNYSSSAPYVGSGAPSSMYLGMPPYGSSLFNGSSIPPYDVPFSGGSAYHYNYGSRLSAGSPYRPLHMSGPPPYSGGSMMGNGGIYGMPPPLMDRYGLGLPMGPAAMGPRPGFFPDDKSQRKGADATRDNDWTCPKCGNINFSFRTVCNMRKCNTPKPGSQAAKSDKNSKQKMPEGSWKCEKCNNINYPFRTKCNRQNCGADKPAESKKSLSPTTEENEQILQSILLIVFCFSPFHPLIYNCLLFHGCRVTLPSHDSCQLVVLNLMVFVVFMDPLIHKVSASLFWQDSTGMFTSLDMCKSWKLAPCMVDPSAHPASGAQDLGTAAGRLSSDKNYPLLGNNRKGQAIFNLGMGLEF